MTINIRIKKIFFWILVVLFLATAPLVIYYAMGYRFSFERGIFVYSGSITLKPTPREIEVFINDKQISTGVVNFLNYSYHIGSILPGEYSVEVRSPQYLPWKKNIHVHSGISSEYWNIFLTREQYTKVQYPTKNTSNFFISPDSKKVALVENENGASVKILDVKKEEIIYDFPFTDCKFLETEKENIEWSPREGRLTVPLEKNGKREYFIINIGTEEVFSLNEKIKRQNIQKVRWSANDKNALFYIFEDKLFRVDLDNPAEEVEVANNVAGYDLSGSDIYYFFKDNGIIYRKDVTGKGEATQITTQSIDATYGDDFRIIAYDEDRIAVISNDKNLYLYNKSIENEGVTKIGEGVLGLHFSNDGKKIVFWNNNGIAVYFVRKWETQPSRTEGQKIEIVRFSQSIENVGWFRDYEHIIFSSGGNIKIVELDQRSAKNINDLVKLDVADAKAVYSTREDNLFFIDKVSEQTGLSSISLAEENQ